MLDTLYARLAAGMLAILLAVTGLLLILDLVSSRRLLQEVNQDVHRDLARHLLEDSIPFQDGEIQPEGLKQIFHMLMVINPAIEVYLLDAEGRILSYSAPEGTVVRMTVDLEPIREFLSGEPKLPILGDDPRSPKDRKVFSVAPLDRDAGFLYVILGGQQYETTVGMFQTSRTLKLGLAGLAATLLAAIAAGLWMFARITRPVRTLATAVRRFQSSEFESPELLRASPRGSRESSERADEIGGLEQSFTEMARRLSEQMHEIKKTDALRRELVANVSHDLRTPITSLRGYLETLIVKSDQLSDEEKQQYVETALRHSERLGDLVSSLFELSKLDSLTTEIAIERVALGEFLQDVLQGFRLRCRDQGIELASAIDPGEAVFVATDVGLIERVLGNLLDNAIRHTPSGGRVTLSLGRMESGYRVAVEDTGPGISEEDLPHLFDRFYRKSGTAEGAPEGAGLGLAIAQQILRLLGSSLEVSTSRGGKGSGSTFSFVLPRS